MRLTLFREEVVAIPTKDMQAAISTACQCQGTAAMGSCDGGIEPLFPHGHATVKAKDLALNFKFGRSNGSFGSSKDAVKHGVIPCPQGLGLLQHLPCCIGRFREPGVPLNGNAVFAVVSSIKVRFEQTQRVNDRLESNNLRRRNQGIIPQSSP